MIKPPQVRIARSYHRIEGVALIPLQAIVQVPPTAQRTRAYAAGDEHQIMLVALLVASFSIKTECAN